MRNTDSFSLSLNISKLGLIQRRIIKEKIHLTIPLCSISQTCTFKSCHSNRKEKKKKEIRRLYGINTNHRIKSCKVSEMTINVTYDLYRPSS